jgi:hypothetical protein
MAGTKRPRDANQLGKLIVDLATGEAQEDTPPETPMQFHGRNGGLKGGKARAERLSPERRSEIAKKAAEARWAKSKG